MRNRSPAWDNIENPDDIWRSDDENDLGYECPKCGDVPSFKDLRNGVCRSCKPLKVKVEESCKE